jgi:hypothetical protein
LKFKEFKDHRKTPRGRVRTKLKYQDSIFGVRIQMETSSERKLNLIFIRWNCIHKIVLPELSLVRSRGLYLEGARVQP